MSTCIGKKWEWYGIVMYELGGIPFLVFFFNFFFDILSSISKTFLLKLLMQLEMIDRSSSCVELGEVIEVTLFLVLISCFLPSLLALQREAHNWRLKG